MKKLLFLVCVLLISGCEIYGPAPYHKPGVIGVSPDNPYDTCYEYSYTPYLVEDALFCGAGPFAGENYCVWEFWYSDGLICEETWHYDTFYCDWYMTDESCYF